MTNLRNAGFEWECVVADAVHFEPVSGSKISLITGKYREFCPFCPQKLIARGLIEQQIQILADQIPYAMNREFCCENREIKFPNR